MTYITSWERDAMELGKAEGRVEGRVHGMLTTVLRQLSVLIEPTPEELFQKIQSLSEDEILKLAEDLLDFRSLEDLEKWFKSC